MTKPNIAAGLRALSDLAATELGTAPKRKRRRKTARPPNHAAEAATYRQIEIRARAAGRIKAADLAARAAARHQALADAGESEGETR